MSLIKFSSIVNIVTGVLLLIIGGLIGAIGVLAKEGELGNLLGHFLSADQQDAANSILNNIYASPQLGLAQLEKLGLDIPASISSFLLETNPFDLLMYIGFGFAGYALIVHIILSVVLFKKASDADEGHEPAPRILALFVGLLSLIPFAAPGVLMMIGILGNTKKPLRRGR